MAECVDIQLRLNELTFPEWKKELTVDHFRVAMLDEFSEFISSGMKWKWWKAGDSPDTENERLELIDVMHFYLSVLLLEDKVPDEEVYLGIERHDGLPGVMFDSSDCLRHNIFVQYVKNMMNEADWTHLNGLLSSYPMTQEEVSATFMAKATLNEIRQMKGYKTGEYVKVRVGVEDNDRLHAVISAFINNEGMTINDVRKGVLEEFLIIDQ